MTSSEPIELLAPRIDTLISLLERLLGQDTPAISPQLEQLLSDLSRIDRSLAQSATALQEMMPAMTGLLTIDDLQQFGELLTQVLQGILDRQFALQGELTEVRRLMQ